MTINDDRVLMVTSDVFGKGDDELGVLLFDKFFALTVEAEVLPGTIVFLNTGVQVLENEELLSALSVLEQKGVKILFCGTCIDFFDLNDDVKVGSIGNMRQIQDMLFTKTVVML